MKVSQISKVIIPVITIMSAGVMAADYKHTTKVRVGYDFLLDAQDKNPNLADLGYVSFDNRTVADWGSVNGWVRLENMFDQSENDYGAKPGGAVKAMLTLNYGLGDLPIDLWFQSFTLSNKSATEENIYIGPGYDFSVGPLSGSVAAGANYSYGSFSKTGESFNGLSGAAASVRLAGFVSPKCLVKLYYIGQFNRSDEHQSTLSYDKYGYQAMLSLDYHLSRSWMLGLAYRYRESWGGATQGGGDFMIEGGYKL